MASLSPANTSEHKPIVQLLAQLVLDNFSSLKYGSNGTYLSDVLVSDREYLGHNIVAVAVDSERHQVVAIDYNLVDDLENPLEHAEQRLIRRLFTDPKYRRYRNDRTLLNVDIYTTLEPCYQCSGIGIVANVKNIYWLQSDPRVNLIINQMITREHDYYAQKMPKNKQKNGSVGENFVVSTATQCQDLFPNGEFRRLIVQLGIEYEKWQFYTQSEPDVLFYQDPTKKKYLSDCDGIPYFLCTNQYVDIIKRLADGVKFSTCLHPEFDLTNEMRKKV